MDPIRVFLAVLAIAAIGFVCLMAWYQTKKLFREWIDRDYK